MFTLRKFVVQLVRYKKLRKVSDSRSKDFYNLLNPSLSKCIPCGFPDKSSASKARK